MYKHKLLLQEMTEASAFLLLKKKSLIYLVVKGGKKGGGENLKRLYRLILIIIAWPELTFGAVDG